MCSGLFNLDFEEGLPDINRIDLFPNPPTQTKVSLHQYSTESSYNLLLNSNSDLSNQTNESKNHHNANMSTNNKSKSSKLRKPIQNKDKLSKTIALPTPSPSPSITSNCSSAESLEEEDNVTNLLKKKKKRFCQKCNTPFRKTRDFMSHLRGHVTLPFLVIKKLSNDNKCVQEYLQKTRVLNDNTSAECSKTSKSKDGSLKLKLKISGNNNHNFHVVRDEITLQPNKDDPIMEEQITEHKQTKGGIRILRADEIKQSKSPTQLLSKTPPLKMIENVQIPNTSMGEIKQNSTESRYFECPTLDGLDQFNGEVSSEAAKDLLQKLLHCNQTDMNNSDMDWSANSTPNEFISIDRLGHICNVCNANFVDNVQLYEHKQLCGHDCFNPISQSLGNTYFHQPHSMHPMNMNYSRGYAEGIRPPQIGYPHPAGMVRHNSIMYPHNDAQIHMHQQHHIAHMQGFSNRPSHYMMSSQIHTPQHQQNMISRRPPPPLYRVPGTQLMASRPAGPSSEQQMIQNDCYSQNYSSDNEIARPGQFLKTKMQKVGYSGVNTQTSNSSVGTPSPPMVMGQQTSIRPKFLSPHVAPIVPISLSQTIQLNRPSQTYLGSGPRINTPVNNNRPIPGSQAPPLARIQNPVQRIMGPASRVPGQGVKIIQNAVINKQLAPGPGNRIPGILGPREGKPQNISKQSCSPNNNSAHPPQKKIKLDAPDNRIPPNRTDGLPVIKSVVGGAVKIHNQAGPQSTKSKDKQGESPIQFNDQISLCLKNREAKKNPKEVASILATRGIIVTQKSGKLRETIEQPVPEKPSSATQEAVQKLQLNNSVSIISKKKIDDQTNYSETDSPPNSNSDPFISCPIENCDDKFLSNEMLNRHTNRDHKNMGPKIISTTSSITATNGGNNVKAFKCKFCPALFSSTEGLQDHQWKSHKTTQTSPDELGIPIIDLKNDDVKKKLAALGITNYIPLTGKGTNNCYGFPIVSVQGASNPNICNILGLGANSLLSLGPIKHIQKKNN